MARIKKADKNRSVSSRNMDDHLVAEAIAVEKSGIDGEKEVQWEAKQGEVHSDVKLEDDSGQGRKVVIRVFDFKANPESFKHHTPSKQDLFNSSLNEIERVLWKDGLMFMKEVEPQLKLSKDKTHYRIVVGAEARSGEFFSDTAQTLSQIVHGNNASS